jgi:hypothetical protein
MFCDVQWDRDFFFRVGDRDFFFVLRIFFSCKYSGRFRTCFAVLNYL